MAKSSKNNSSFKYITLLSAGVVMILAILINRNGAIFDYRSGASNIDPYRFTCELGYKRTAAWPGCDFSNTHLMTLDPGETEIVVIDLSKCNRSVTTWSVVMRNWICNNKGQIVYKKGTLPTVSTKITKVSPEGIESPVICGTSNPWCSYEILVHYHWVNTNTPVTFKFTSTNTGLRPVNVLTNWSGGIGSP